MTPYEKTKKDSSRSELRRVPFMSFDWHQVPSSLALAPFLAAIAIITTYNDLSFQWLASTGQIQHGVGKICRRHIISQMDYLVTKPVFLAKIISPQSYALSRVIHCKVIHGDLAARNVLVFHLNFVKGAYFVISKQLYGSRQYTTWKQVDTLLLTRTLLQIADQTTAPAFAS